MDVREKLEVIVHLGDHITYKEDIGICYDSALAKVIEDAYMTLKNGVTVQELDGCEYCIDGKTIETDIDGEIEIVKIVPLPAIDLMTGEQESKVNPPYWAIRLLLDGSEDFVQINCCPMCGRRLPQPPKGE